ncbi:MAG: hypothetical protein NTW60_02815 [Candidatus Wolfebacteria bacterium]|nr:hypothetical protein [Candidatus Wolfebacteria bacterium]
MFDFSRLKKGTSTYMPMLIKIIQMTDGPVMELGSGLFSTPLLHWLCSKKKRELVTYENNPEYYQLARKFRSRNHKIRFVKTFDEVDFSRHWNVVLIDHSPKRPLRRGDDVIKLKDSADYIILHDSELEEEKHYGYDKVWEHFKYRHNWDKCLPHVTVLSNFKNLSHLC